MTAVNAQQSGDAGSDIIELTLTEIATFGYGDMSSRVWASTRNQSTTNAHEWLFRHEPLMLPVLDQNGDLAVEVREYGRSEWQTSFYLAFTSPEAKLLAENAIRERYPNQASEILANQVDVLLPRTLSITIPILRDYPEARIADSIGPSSPHSVVFQTGRVVEVLISIISPDESTAREISEKLSTASILYSYTFSARQSLQNAVRFSLSRLVDSKLYAELSGKGQSSVQRTIDGDVFVHRDDLRELLEGISYQVDFGAVLEDPDHFDEALFERLLDSFLELTEASSETFDDEKWAATYHSDDLKPSVIEAFLRDEYEKTEREVSYKGQGSLQGKGSAFFGLVKGSGGGSLSYEQFEKRMADRGIKVDLSGELIVVKSVDVQRMNIARLEISNELTSVITRLSPIETTSNSGTINIQQFINRSEGVPNLYARSLELEQRAEELEQKLNEANEKIRQLTSDFNDVSQRLSNIIGQPVEKALDVTHRAPSHGFLMVAIGGDGSEDTFARLGMSSSENVSLRQPFDGTSRIEHRGIGTRLTFVRQGEYYRATKTSGGASVRLLFVPLATPAE